MLEGRYTDAYLAADRSVTVGPLGHHVTESGGSAS